jgi:hypothetical protein
MTENERMLTRQARWQQGRQAMSWPEKIRQAEQVRPSIEAFRQTRSAARAYVKGWAETGRLLERQRWTELAALGDADALAASDMLIEAALQVPLPAARLTWSGLVSQQDAFHRRRP